MDNMQRTTRNEGCYKMIVFVTKNSTIKQDTILDIHRHKDSTETKRAYFCIEQFLIPHFTTSEMVEKSSAVFQKCIRYFGNRFSVPSNPYSPILNLMLEIISHTYKGFLYYGEFVPVLFFFNRAPPHECLLGKRRYSSTHSLTTALGRGEWSASRPSSFTARERAPGTHWIGGWLGPRAVLVAVVDRLDVTKTVTYFAFFIYLSFFIFFLFPSS